MWEQVVARVGKVRATSVFSNWEVLMPDIQLNLYQTELLFRYVFHDLT